MTAASPPRPAPAADDTAGEEVPGDFIYDAFISYSGFRKEGDAADFDRKVADRLHRALEAYRVPRALTKRADGRAPVPRRLKKIFRDRDEMRAGSSLNQSLTEALRRSRFLIVVCSPRARQSRWMNQEIAIFHGLGRSEQILPLLIEGEPTEAFPEELFRARAETSLPGAAGDWLSQPLAADIRAPSVSESLRLLKEEKLRLLAAILGCEYDDLRQREHERFVRRLTTAGAAMLAGLLILGALSLLLYFARQGERRNKELAVNAASAILPLTGLDPNQPLGANDPATRELYMGVAVRNLERIRQDDPENLDCLTTLRALYAARSKLFEARGRQAEAREDFQRARSMVVPIALSRLGAWGPTQAGRVRGLPGDAPSFPTDYELKRLRHLLDIMQPMEDIADVKHAVEYVEYAAEYVPLLDTSAEEGRAEARRVLRSSLNRFRNAQSFEPLTEQQADLVEAIETALGRLSP
jgi:hypothetical protein